MARFRSPYRIFSRVVPSGATVYYYSTYTPDGKRIYRSTGLTDRRKAEAYCLALHKQDKLVPTTDVGLLDYARPFFGPECRYVRRRENRENRKLSVKYVQFMRLRLLGVAEKIGNISLSAITPAKIEDALDALRAHINNAGVNVAKTALSVVLQEAVRENLIDKNPCEVVDNLATQAAAKGILSLVEARALFAPQNWLGAEMLRVLNMTAAVTGMRRGELLALHAEDVHDDYIRVHRAFAIGDGIKNRTKTGKVRIVPIPQHLRTELRAIMPSKLMFHVDGAMIYSNAPQLSLYRALALIGIDEAARRKRNITFHSWRHFFNTFCRSAGVPDAKLQAVTGHSTLAMTDHYTHFAPEDFAEVVSAQNKMLGD